MNIHKFNEETSRLIEIMEGFADLSHIGAGDIEAGVRVLRRQLNSIDDRYSSMSDEEFKSNFRGRRLGEDIFLGDFDNPISTLILDSGYRHLGTEPIVPFGVESSIEKIFLAKNLKNWRSTSGRSYIQNGIQWGGDIRQDYSVSVRPVSAEASICIVLRTSLEERGESKLVPVAVSFLRYHAAGIFKGLVRRLW